MAISCYTCYCSYDKLYKAKEAVEQEYILYRKELKHTSVGATTKVIYTVSDLILNNCHQKYWLRFKSTTLTVGSQKMQLLTAVIVVIINIQ